MNKIVTLAAPERLDTLCFKHYGHLVGSVEAVLAANIGLAHAVTDERGMLPIGTQLIMPVLPRVAPQKIKLW